MTDLGIDDTLEDRIQIAERLQPGPGQVFD